MSSDGGSRPISLPPSEAESLNVNGGSKEAKLFELGLSAEEISRREATGEHRRAEKFRDHFERVALCGLWLAGILIAAVAVAWLWHLMMPSSVHWLDSDHVSKLQNIVTGGVLVGVAMGHVKRRLGSG